MIYKCTVVTDETELPNILKHCIDVQPVYKSAADNSDINYVVTKHFENVICDNAYSEYCESFKGREILTKRKFYNLVKYYHGLKITATRVGGSIKTIFHW